MPASITHYIIAKTAERELPPELWTAVKVAPDYYFAGSQGPDIFFFYHPVRQNLGKYLHRNSVYKLFLGFLHALRIRSGEAHTYALAYTLGYVSHYCADVTFHPYVYSYLGERSARKSDHQLIENDWDVYFARKYLQAEAEYFPFPYSAGKLVRENVLLPFLMDALLFCGIAASASELKGALKAYGRYLTFFHGNCYARRRLFSARISSLFPRKTPNKAYLCGAEFERLSGVKDADTLFLAASEESASLMRIFSECLLQNKELPRGEFSKHLLTGKNT